MFHPTSHCAVTGEKQSLGRTAGEALDSLAEQLDPHDTDLVVVVRTLVPDQYFTIRQQEQLEALMWRWREARDKGGSLSPDDQTELESLVEAELRGSAERAADMVDEPAR